MSSFKKTISFSSNGEYLAYSSPDGCLKIWETSTSVLKQEYTPSSHLSATCSSLSWCPSKQIHHSSKKSKKLKDSNEFSILDLQLISMGTLTGDILLYSYTNADLHSYLTNGHSGVVNDLCWCASTCSLYSCSSDQQIIVWDLLTGKVKTKWKTDSGPIYSISLINSKNLLSASNSIHLWSVEQKVVLKTFTGHASEVFKLIPMTFEEKIENSYFLSSAVGDRVINAWQLNEENNKRAVASFVVSDEPEYISIAAENNKSLILSVVCKNGVLHIFEHVLNGRKKKPLTCKFSVQIASKLKEIQPKPLQVPILAATLSTGLSSCIISYGSFIKPMFERLDLSDVSNDVYLIREISSPTSFHDDVSRVKQTDKSSAVKLLAPGHLMPVKDLHIIPRKRKKKEIDENELPMEERLKALDLSKIPANLEETTLKADSMVHLLLQGLQSKDFNLLNTVLYKSDDELIHNTLKRLPLPSIILLLKELQRRLNKQEQRNHPCLKWLKGLLSIHLPYLMSCKDIDEYLGPIGQLIEARIENFTKMCQLQGCLKILLSEASVNKSQNLTSEEPLIIYQSESSEESDADESDKNSNVSDVQLPHESEMEESTTSDDESEFDMDT